jgi:hypothetical protein
MIKTTKNYILDTSGYYLLLQIKYQTLSITEMPL